MKWNIESRTRISYTKKNINIYCIIIYKKLFFLTIILTMKYVFPASFSFPCRLALFLTSLFVHFALFHFFRSPDSNSSFLFFVYFLLSPLPFNSTLFKPFSNAFHTIRVVHNTFIRAIRVVLYL